MKDATMHCLKCGYDGHPDYHDPFRCQVLEQLVNTAERAEWTAHLLEMILQFLRENRPIRLGPETGPK